MNSHLKPTLLIGLVVAILSACSGGGGGASTSVSVPPLDATPVASGLNPSPDGFSFANFASTASTEEFNADDMVAMFGNGAEICTSTTSPCTLTAEATAWARMVNQARSSGHCEGLAVLSASRFQEKSTPATFSLQNSGDTTHAIIRAFATQFLNETTNATKAWAKQSPSDIVAALSASLKTGKPEFSLGVYTDGGGHAILPYAVEWPSEKVAKVKVYDSNWPGGDRYVTVDLESQEWTFSFSGKDPANDPNIWKGGKGDIDITPLSSRVTGTCPFCGEKSGVQKTLLLIRSASSDWEVETPDGTVSATNNSAGETTAQPLRSASTTPGAPVDYLVYGTTGKTKITSKSVVAVAGFTGSVGFQYTTTGKNDTTVDVSASGISTDDPTVTATLADGNIVATASGENTSLTSTGEQIAVVTETESGQKVEATATADTGAIAVDASPDKSGVGYTITTQSAPNEITVKSVDDAGNETEVTKKGQLDSTKTSNELPQGLEAPAVKPGLPSVAVRVAAAKASARSNNAVSTRGNADISFDTSGWTIAKTASGSKGFQANLVVNDGSGSSIPACTDISCVKGMSTSILTSGTDAKTQKSTTTSMTFTMANVQTAFSVKCGDAPWQVATQSGSTYAAYCDAADITSDLTIYISNSVKN